VDLKSDEHEFAGQAGHGGAVQGHRVADDPEAGAPESGRRRTTPFGTSSSRPNQDRTISTADADEHACGWQAAG